MHKKLNSLQIIHFYYIYNSKPCLLYISSEEKCYAFHLLPQTNSLKLPPPNTARICLQRMLQSEMTGANNSLL